MPRSLKTGFPHRGEHAFGIDGSAHAGVVMCVERGEITQNPCLRHGFGIRVGIGCRAGCRANTEHAECMLIAIWGRAGCSLRRDEKCQGEHVASNPINTLPSTDWIVFHTFTGKTDNASFVLLSRNLRMLTAWEALRSLLDQERATVVIAIAPFCQKGSFRRPNAPSRIWACSRGSPWASCRRPTATELSITS